MQNLPCRTTLSLSIASLFFGLYSPAQAENLEIINVIGRPIEGSVQRAVSIEADSDVAMAVIDAEQLAQFNEQSLGDALRRVPGITFDGANRAREVRLRGLPDQYTQVLINGRPVLDGNSRRTVEVDRIPTGLIERIEVMRSPRVSLGSQGAAGTVNIVLKSGAQLPTQITVGGGYLEDNGFQGESAFVTGGKTGAIEYGVAVNAQRFLRSESKDLYTFNQNNEISGATLGLNEREFDQFTLAPKLSIEIDESRRLLIEPIYLRTKETRKDIKTPLKADLVTQERVTDELRERVRETYGLYSGLEQELTHDMRLRFGIDWQQGSAETERNEIRFNTNGSINRERQRTEDIQLKSLRPELVLSIPLNDHDIAIGLEANSHSYDENNGESTNGIPAQPRADRIFNVNEDLLVAWAEDSWLMSDNLRASFGVRFERSNTETEDFFNLSNEKDATYFLPAINMTYAIQPTTDLRFGVARTLRRPDFRTLSPATEARDGTAADPDLQGNPYQDPESIWGADIGLYHYFMDRAGLLSVNTFARFFSDKIENTVRIEDERYIAAPHNTGNARAVGIELNGRLPIASSKLGALTLWGNAVYTHARVDDEIGGQRRFLDQPDLVSNIGLDYEIIDWHTVFGLAMNRSSSIEQSQYLLGGGFIESSIDSRTRLDMSMRTEVTKDAVLTLSLTNLLGQSEDREDRQVSETYNLQSATNTIEPTYRAIYARLNWSF